MDDATRPPNPAHRGERLSELMTPLEVMAATHLSRGTVYALIRRGDLAALSCGRVEGTPQGAGGLDRAGTDRTQEGVAMNEPKAVTLVDPQPIATGDAPCPDQPEAGCTVPKVG